VGIETARLSAVGPQQTIVSSTTRVVVVVIPGFPAESIVLGFLAGIIVVLLVRQRQAVKSPRRG
jgi:type III secretory pathway component EscV